MPRSAICCPAGAAQSSWLIYLTNFCIAIEYGILMPTVWEYLEEDLHVKDKVWLGVSLATFSVGRTLFFPLVGHWSDRRGFRVPYASCYFLGIVGGILYGAAGRAFGGCLAFVIAGRFVSGIGASCTAMSSAFISVTRAPNRRTNAMALNAAFLLLGHISGPAFNAGLVNLNVTLAQNTVELNKKTAAGYLMAIVNLVLLLLYCCCFKEPPRGADGKVLAVSSTDDGGTGIGGGDASSSKEGYDRPLLSADKLAGSTNDTNDLLPVLVADGRESGNADGDGECNDGRSSGRNSRRGSFSEAGSGANALFDTHLPEALAATSASRAAGQEQEEEEDDDDDDETSFTATNASIAGASAPMSRFPGQDSSSSSSSSSTSSSRTSSLLYTALIEHGGWYILSCNFVQGFEIAGLETAVTPITKNLYHWGTLQNSLMFAAIAGIALVGVAVIGLARRCDKDGPREKVVRPRRLMVVGFVFMAASFCVSIPFVTRHGELPLWVMMTCGGLLIFGVPLFAAPGNSIYSCMVPQEHSGLFMGLGQIVLGVARSVSPLAAGATLHSTTTDSGNSTLPPMPSTDAHSYRWLFLLLGLVYLIAPVGMLFTWRKLIIVDRGRWPK